LSLAKAAALGYPGPQVRPSITQAAAALLRGELVAFPTETVYGLGAHAFDERAVAQIFEAKGRPTFDPLIVHVADHASAELLVTEWPKAARRLAAHFWPGPLTLVLPKRAEVPDLVTAGEPTVAVRVPAHPLALALLRAAGVPIAAPSANLFGRISPTTAAHVEEQLGGVVKWILDGGPTTVGVESTILAFPEGRPVLLRPGGVPLEAIEALIGPVEAPGPEVRATMAPGQLPQHYAPRTPLYILPRRPPPGVGPIGRLALIPPADPGDVLEVLSPSGDLTEAAARLFAAMRKLDQSGVAAIVADPVPAIGLGRAIMDRLQRAAFRPVAKPGLK
jgi:L-threonylcarbamoyladenylate synthase